VERALLLVTAIIRPEKLEEVRRALSHAYVTGITVTEVMGFGRQRGHVGTYRGAEYQSFFLPKLELEVAILERDLDAVVSALVRVAASGKVGDGKIFVRRLENVVRIRTGEQGPDAL
jgi:nitrogen regulatory protein PII